MHVYHKEGVTVGRERHREGGNNNDESFGGVTLIGKVLGFSESWEVFTKQEAMCECHLGNVKSVRSVSMV